MDIDVILDRLEALLDEERLAIRALQGARVEAIALEKLDWMRQLDALREGGFRAHAPRVKDVVQRLRHNSVLLVQAKAILADAVRLKRTQAAVPVVCAPPRPSRGPEKRLSIVG